MLTKICAELRNWFLKKRYFGSFEIQDGVLTYEDGEIDVKEGQYYRIIGSVFNDGVYLRGSETLIDEAFDGAVWTMAVPKDLISLAAKIEAWESKYGGVDSANMSPFNSESFKGYSYSKSGGGSSDGSGTGTWQKAFAKELNPWRKI